MSSVDKKARSVFVGNIPYDTTEQQLLDLFNTVGPVVSFRLVSDRETGKPKGYGFCEYRDLDTAASAIRNLNNYELNGRSLRVHYAEEDKQDGDAKGRVGGPGAQSAAGTTTTPNTTISTPAPIPANAESILKLVSSFTSVQQAEILNDMKRFIQQRPQAARNLLVENPQLAQALLQLQLKFNLIRANDIQNFQARAVSMPMDMMSVAPNVMSSATVPPISSTIVTAPSLPPSSSSSIIPPASVPPVAYSVPNLEARLYPGSSIPPTSAVPPMMHPMSNVPPPMPYSNIPPPSMNNMPYPPSNVTAPAPQPSPPAVNNPMGISPQNMASLTPQQQQLLNQVIKLTDDQISKLPANVQQQIRELKKKIGLA